MSARDVLFVGSVPMDSGEAVFQHCAAAVGEHAFAFPDGELGARQMWVLGLGDLVFSKHPDLVRLPDVPVPWGAYALRDGVQEISFDDVYPYADFALESYATFRRLRDAGEIPAGSRFQVSLPTPHAAIISYFVDRAVWPMVLEAWAAAMRRGYERMLAEIPAEDLVIQLDYCTELSEILGDPEMPTQPAGTREERLETYTGRAYVEAMASELPDAVTLGYHICLGTWPSWPRNPQDDLTFVVELANRLIASTPRRVDFLHLPAMADADEAFFAPLRDLTPGPKPFLGIECRDGADALQRRAAAARVHVADFGIAHFCGYGREDAERIDALLADLAVGAQAL